VRLLAFVLDTVSAVARIIAASITLLTLLGIALIASGSAELGGGYGVGDLALMWLVCTVILIVIAMLARLAAGMLVPRDER
jgi:hypothetical protein